VASNQVEDYRRKRDAYNEALKNGVSGSTLAQLKAAMEAAKQAVESAGGSTSGGILS
jgi:hypothetical protein